MGAGGVVAAVGAAMVMLMVVPGMASAQGEPTVEDAWMRSNRSSGTPPLAAEDSLRNAEALKDETVWTGAGIVLGAYGDAIEYWPESTPEVRFLDEEVGGGPVHQPPQPDDIVRPPPDSNKPAAPPTEEAARERLEKVLGNQTNKTAPETHVTSEADAPSDNETMLNATTAPEPLTSSTSEPSGDPEPAVRPPQANPPEPMGTVVSEVPSSPTAEIAAFATASIAVVVLAWLLSQARFVGRLLAGVPGAALFSRQTGTEVLQNPVRAQIHAAVTHESGITFAKLRQIMEMPPSTLRYHLAILQRENLIKVTRRGVILHYHGGAARVDRQEQAREYLFWRDRGLLASTILQHPGANQKAVARITGLLPSRVSEYTKELADAGLVRSERVGRCRQYFPTPMLQAMMDSGQVPTSRG